MVKAVFEKDGDRYSLTMDGHATGSKEVCAASTAVVTALAGYLANAPVALEVADMESGHAKIVCRGGRLVREAFKMAEIGLLQIEQGHGDYIKVQ